MNEVGYENDTCHFCGAKEAGYWREKDGKMYDACMKCAKGENSETKAKGS